jgi:hypothetical protein
LVVGVEMSSKIGCSGSVADGRRCGMIALSWTGIKDSECPFRFHALKIARTYKEPQSVEMEIGSNVAEILQTYRMSCLRNAVNSDVELLLKLGAAKNPDPNKTSRIMELIERFLNTDLVNMPTGASWIRVESKYAFDAKLKPLPDKDGWFDKKAAFRMVSDFAYIQDGVLIIVDDKTGRGDTDKRQLDYYADLLQRIVPPNQIGGYDRIVCILNELGKGRVDIVAEYQPGPVNGVCEEIMQHLKRVNSWTEYPAVACSRCQYCTVPGCPIRESNQAALVIADQSPVAMIPTELTTREEAEKAMMFVLFAEAVTDQVKELLRGYVQRNGPVVACGKIAEERPNNPWKVKDLQRLVNSLVAFGIQPAAICNELSLSESALEKLCKKSRIQERLPMLLSMGERKDYKPKFGLYNDKLR